MSRRVDLPELSIALCTYNGERFLSEQLNSLNMQSRLPDELVVCDDGSSDRTLDILKRFSEHAHFPVYIHQNRARLGPSKNFEQAVSFCKGDVIALCDQDDVWLPGKLKYSLQYLSCSTEAHAVFSDGLVVDPVLNSLGYTLWDRMGFNQNEQQKVLNGDALEVLLKHFTVTGSALTIKRRLLEYALPIPEGWMHDAWIAIIAAAMGGLGLIPDELLLYRQHGNNTIGVARHGLASRWKETLQLNRAAYYAGELQRYREALNRLKIFSHACCPDSFGLIAAKLSHLENRACLPEKRLHRIPHIIRELVKLGYKRYSVSWQVAVMDFLMCGD